MTMTLDDVRAILAPDEASESQVDLLDASAVRHLLTLATGDDPALAVKATYALGVTPTVDGGEALQRLADHPDPRIRMGAVSALRSYDRSVAEPVLLRLLDDPDPGVAKMVVRAVPAQVSPELARALRAWTRQAPHPDLRHLGRSVLRRTEAPPDKP